MARIELRGIAHSYQFAPRAERDYALKLLDLTWEDGGAYALLGPSGCGKTTLLGIISGLLKPSEGSVLIDGRDITALSPRERNIAQVFQFPVIYDTMSVFDNLAFPLRNRGMPRREIASRVEHVAQLLELHAELPRRASGLPGELKQRISLGRGLVRKDVAAILLDEPLTVIDPQLKWQLRRKLMEVHRELHVTLIYVTHDQLEALTLAERVVVMRDGSVLQSGTPNELFERPEHTFVGHFIGSPGMNILPCEVRDGAVRIAEQVVACPVPEAALTGSGPLELGVRPEYVQLLEQPASGTPAVQVSEHIHLGASALVSVRLGPHTLRVKADPGARFSLGETRYLALSAAHTHLYRDGRLVAG
jgi:glycerol transport system ATP-binding protein